MTGVELAQNAAVRGKDVLAYLIKVAKAKAKAQEDLCRRATHGDCDGIRRQMMVCPLDIDALVDHQRVRPEFEPCSGETIRMTALHGAVAHHQEAAARLLLELGANPNLADSDGCPPLVSAAGVGALSILRMLLDAKAEANAVHPTGWTAFHCACENNQPDCAEALVRAGCDTMLRTKDGATAREMAQNEGHAAVLERLDALGIEH